VSGPSHEVGRDRSLNVPGTLMGGTRPVHG
jgi:hypothetical protein